MSQHEVKSYQKYGCLVPTSSPCPMWVQVCWCGRLERRLINSRVPGIDLFLQMRQQDVGVATEITITSAAAL